jgi:hypothetical protein
MGRFRFANVRPGAYRLKFVREGSITLERDITVRGGEAQLVDVTSERSAAAAKTCGAASRCTCGLGQIAWPAGRSQS